MKLGISSSCFYPLETEIALKEISENKVNCTEIFYNCEKERKSYFTDEVLKFKDNFGLEIVALHPMMSLAEPYMIFSDYLRRFDEARDDFLRYFETAAELGAKFINLHGDRKNGKLPNEEYFERFGIMATDAKSFGVTLCQENVNAFRSADPEFILEMKNYLGELANFTLDIKQCVRAGYSVTDVINAMGDRIKHVHISDHSPASDCLLPLRGGFDFSAFFSLLKQSGYDGAFIIEVYRNAYQNTGEIFESYNKLKTVNSKLFK